MSGDITRLPPASRGEKPETERERRKSENVERLLPAWMVGEGGKILIEMGDRWRCEAYSEDDRKDLDDAPDRLAFAERELERRLANGVG